MDRLLTLRLAAEGCDAAAWFNGFPLARVDGARRDVVVPVHEYTLPGANRIDLVLWTAPGAAADARPVLPRASVADQGKAWARLQLLLTRAGQAVEEGGARPLALLDWAPAAGQLERAALRLSQRVTLPVRFPRWRWRDAGPAEHTPAVQTQALGLLQRLMRCLVEGDSEDFIAATRTRIEELALAYGRPVDEAIAAQREYIAELSASRLAWAPLRAEGLRLLPVADGRLLECLDTGAEPALRTLPDASGGSHRLAIRLATRDGVPHVLR